MAGSTVVALAGGTGLKAGAEAGSFREEAERRRAGAYDSWFDSRWGQYAFKVEARALLAALGDLKARRLLDVGCGSGRFTALFETRGARATGVDLDASMLSLAAQCVRVRLLLADAHRLPFPDATFDVTVATTVLEFTAEPARVIGEMARVTAPGGRLVIGTLNPSSPWGVAHRRRLRQAPWTDAHFMDRRQLHEWVAPYGTTTLRAALFAPGDFSGLGAVGPLLELVGRTVPAWGAFQVLAVDLLQE